MMAGKLQRGILYLGLMVGAIGSGGCCGLHQGCGPGGWYALLHPIAWHGACNECGPGPGGGCDDTGAVGGLGPWLRRQLTAGHGCSEIYWGEWISDPPDCADPCDLCHGQWTGPGGICRLGPAQRILAGLHGYRYCPPPYCGPWCPIFPRHAGRCCGPADACGAWPGAGWGFAEGLPHGADIYYQGPPEGALPHDGSPTPAFPGAESHEELLPGGTSILDENWEIPRAKPQPGQPIHEARPPLRPPLGRQAPAQMSQVVQVPGRTFLSPGDAPTGPAPRRVVGSGVRPASGTR